MRVVKRLYLFILKNFLPLFAMTFFIVLFIVLMQFLWRYIDDLVGKGLSVGVLGELFFYAAVSMVPMALPLAILLASLMTFGNLGEKSELTAIKASGVSLVKAMSPLIILIMLVAVGAFFFQNNVLPKAQVKMWTILFSARQKSPELEIPEGAFYDQIPGYNLYVKSKNKETGVLHDVMIYDVGNGSANATILVADSARLAFTKDLRYLYLYLWKGEQFENLREQRTGERNVPFRRESFQDKEILIPFDNNFNRLDEGGMRNQYVGKNMAELRQTLDSLDLRIDSLKRDAALCAKDPNYNFYMSGRNPNASQSSDEAAGGMGSIIAKAGIGPDAANAGNGQSEANAGKGQSAANARKGQSVGRADAGKGQGAGKAGGGKDARSSAMAPPLDSLLLALSPAKRDALFSSAENAIQSQKMSMEFRAIQLHDEHARYRRHQIELIKKFTLSVACIIFLFIGAPLGAIIRKGGLGTPLVISVLLFLVYYIIDNTGYKLARDGHWIVWVGMWLSTFILLPLGIFVTYKAMNDSAVFNPDLYKAWIRRRLGLPESRQVAMKEVVINEVNPGLAAAMTENLHIECAQWLATHKVRPSYTAYWRGDYDPVPIDRIGEDADRLVEYMSDSKSAAVNDWLNKFAMTRSLWILRPTKRAGLRTFLKWFLPVGLLLYLLALPYARRTHTEIASLAKVTSGTGDRNLFHSQNLCDTI